MILHEADTQNRFPYAHHCVSSVRARLWLSWFYECLADGKHLPSPTPYLFNYIFKDLKPRREKRHLNIGVKITTNCGLL